MERGEVRWYTFPVPDKTRPVLILTRGSAIRYLNAVTVAPITTTVRGVPSEVKLTTDDGLPKDCAVNFHNLQTVAKARIGAWITNLSPERMAEVDRALLFALGVDLT
jgi:mRNA interferase MazF